MAPEMYKKRLLESESGDTTLTNTLTGLWARSLANRFTREYTESGAPACPRSFSAAPPATSSSRRSSRATRTTTR